MPGLPFKRRQQGLRLGQQQTLLLQILSRKAARRMQVLRDGHLVRLEGDHLPH
jgi:hypothetical protein